MILFIVAALISPFALGTMAALRWRRCAREGKRVAFQLYISDLITGTLWLAVAGLVFSMRIDNYLGAQVLVAILLSTGIFAGLVAGKVFHLTTRTPHARGSAFYLSMGAISGLVLAIGSGFAALMELISQIQGCRPFWL